MTRAPDRFEGLPDKTLLFLYHSHLYPPPLSTTHSSPKASSSSLSFRLLSALSPLSDLKNRAAPSDSPPPPKPSPPAPPPLPWPGTPFPGRPIAYPATVSRFPLSLPRLLSPLPDSPAGVAPPPPDHPHTVTNNPPPPRPPPPLLLSHPPPPLSSTSPSPPSSPLPPPFSLPFSLSLPFTPPTYTPPARPIRASFLSPPFRLPPAPP